MIYHDLAEDEPITQRKCVISGGVKSLASETQSMLINDLGFQIVQ